MKRDFLDILECPFCGDGLRVQRDSTLETRGDDVVTAILGCQCCAYPVVDGIPFIHVGGTADQVMKMIDAGGAGRNREALFALLGLDEPSRRERFARMLDDEQSMTFRGALEVLSRDAEGVYLLYRFSDPTFLASQAVLETVARDPRSFAGHAIDVCGGAGHLTRTLVERAGATSNVVLADIAYWKIWLASRFVAPGCWPVCCDASNPLPFARGAFSLACCADAFHYVWPRRLLAGEMARLVGERGAVVLLHLHNALCDNFSAGMPLTPAGYRRLFDGSDRRLLKQDDVLEDVLANRPIDLSTGRADDELADAHDLALIATRLEEFPRAGGDVSKTSLPRRRMINPLYRIDRTGDRCVLTLAFPSDEYEQEFGGCTRYLPRLLELAGAELDGWLAGKTDEKYESLSARRVILELPERYV